MSDIWGKTWLRSTFRSLRYRNYRLFFAGQGVSLMGTWIQRIALPWYVFRLTGSPFLLGVVSFAGWIPAIILSPVAGAIIDRWDRYKVLLWTQVLSMAQALALSVYYFTGGSDPLVLIALSLLLGCINAFDIPARQSFVVDMVDDRKDLGNAIALNSSMFNAARLVGPSVAGIMIALTNEGICFAVNGASFIFVIGSLLAMNLREKELHGKGQAVMRVIREGFAYTFGFAPVRNIMVLLALLSFMGMPFIVLMPVFAKDVLMGGPRTYGFLMGAMGAGALIGALYLASRKDARGLTRIIAGSSVGFSIVLVAFSLSRWLVLSLVLMSFIGLGMILLTASSNTILQTIVDDDKRARVMSFYALAIVGIFPLGSLFMGFFADRFGAPLTLGFGGSICIMGSLLFASRMILNGKNDPIETLIHER
ncbi:MAG: MFS transporter [Candidatus Thermoplasmatota archaeon]|nr:MFS transporter [Candidatus Thermoplasmatota archaeon]